MKAVAVVIALVVNQAACDDTCYDVRSWTGTIDLPAEPMVQFAIDRCQRDADVCLDLCRLVIGVRYDRLDRCELTVEGMRASIVGTYAVYLGGEGCAFPLPDAAVVAPPDAPVPDAPVPDAPVRGPDAGL